MGALFWITAAVASVLLAAAIAPPSRRTANAGWRRTIALAIGALVLCIPWVVNERPLWVVVIALASILGFLRLTDVIRSTRPMTPGQRIFHALSYPDSRKIIHVARAFDFRGFARVIFWDALTGVSGYVGLTTASHFTGATHYAIRWLAGAVVAYAVTDGAYALLNSAFLACGLQVGKLHDSPVLATSVGDFWGMRWNRIVSSWLRDNCFMPYARKRAPRMGLALAFFASAGLHAYLLAPIGWRLSAEWFAFFAANGALVMIEIRIGVRRWPRPAARTWTILTMLAVSPLFVEPMMRVLEDTF